jgi:hypothetical protein
MSKSKPGLVNDLTDRIACEVCIAVYETLIETGWRPNRSIISGRDIINAAGRGASAGVADAISKLPRRLAKGGGL